MYTLEDLFDRRSPVGTRLEQILIEKNVLRIWWQTEGKKKN